MDMCTIFNLHITYIKYDVQFACVYVFARTSLTASNTQMVSVIFHGFSPCRATYILVSFLRHIQILFVRFIFHLNTSIKLTLPTAIHFACCHSHLFDEKEFQIYIMLFICTHYTPVGKTYKRIVSM